MTRNEWLETDTVVIGAGVVGLAVASVLAEQGREVIVLEAGPRFGEGISSRNSEVIHAGIYYPTNSLKARLCVEGRQQLYQYCREHQVNHRKTGKWIVAISADQAGDLDAIRRQSAANGVPLEWRNGTDVEEALPGVRAEAALYSPETGIVDSHGLMVALLADLEAQGGQLVCHAPVVAASSSGEGHVLSVGGDNPCDIRARRVVNSAGLGAVPLAAQWLGYLPALCPRQWFARGVYFSYSGRAPFSSLIYPVPEPGGLGVHLTLDLAGQARFGPDVEWIAEPEFSVDPARKAAFVRGIQAWWPAMDPERLQPAYAGVRPKLSGPGEPAADFIIQGPADHGVPGLVHLFGIESPGLTSCLAIAGQVAARLA